MQYKVNIIIVNDDSFEVGAVRSFYESLLTGNELPGLVGADVQGAVVSVANAMEAENCLERAYDTDPGTIQILHVEDKKIEEGGRDFIHRMRWKFAGRRIGALLTGEDWPSADHLNSKRTGIYRYVAKPLENPLVLSNLEKLFGLIFTLEKPQKKLLNKSFMFSRITEQDDFLDYLRLRYKVFDFMNYLQQKNEEQIDLDKFDPYSIPFGVYLIEEEKRNLVGTIRVITTRRQQPYSRMIDEILDWHRTRLMSRRQSDLCKLAGLKMTGPFPTAESFDLSGLLKGYDAEGKDYGEFSRVISHPDYRGFGLSQFSLESAIAWARLNQVRIIFGSCATQHVNMYSKYGWKIIPGTCMFFEKKVEQVAYAMVMDLENEVVEPTRSLVDDILLPGLMTYGFTYMYPENDGYVYGPAPSEVDDLILFNTGRAINA